jgi:hypothetical protein
VIRAGYYQPRLFLRINLHVAHSRCGDKRHAGLLFHGTPRQDVLKSARVPMRELFFGSYRLKELPFQSRSLNIKLERKKNGSEFRKSPLMF